jgi:hypothetical protein
VRTIAEDLPDEAREDVARAHLDEGPHAHRVEALDRLDEAHRRAELAREHTLGVRRGGRIRVGRAVRDDRQPRGAEADALEERGERRDRALHDGRVERRRDLEPLRRDPRRLEDRLGLGDRVGASREHHLIGGVVVRDGDVELLAEDDRLEVRALRDHRGHRALRGLRRVAHALTAGARDTERVLGREHARGVERHDLAEAVARERRGQQAHLQEEPVGREARGAEARLRPLRRGDAILLRLLGSINIIVATGLAPSYWLLTPNFAFSGKEKSSGIWCMVAKNDFPSSPTNCKAIAKPSLSF